MKKNYLPFKKILKELTKIFSQIGSSDLKIFLTEVTQAKRIYVLGAGRSGLIAKNLAMRLVRLKKKTFVIGETITPMITINDLLIVVSGSGETGEVLNIVKISRVKGARILGITGVKDSPLARLSHSLILIPAKIPKRLGSQYQLRELIGVEERSPLKSLFEVASLIFLEIGVSKLNGKK